MRDRVNLWLLGLALVGLVAAASSTYVHLQMITDPAYTSFCDINATVSCTQVYQSRYGTVYGVPVAFGGVVWFIGVLLLSVASRFASSATTLRIGGYLLVWSTIGLSVAMYMAYASFFVLQTICVLCLIVYASVIGIFLLSGNIEAAQMRQLPLGVVIDVGLLVRRPLGLGVFVLFVIGMIWPVFWFANYQYTPPVVAGTESGSAEVVPPVVTSDQQSEFERYWESQPRVSIDLGRDINDGVLVTVVKFNDYQCPACANAHRLYQPVFQKYESSHPGRVRQVTLDYPLDPTCNDQAPNGLHLGACAAAVAVRLASEQGVGQREAMEEWLYGNQAGLSRESVVDALGQVVGISETDYTAEFDRLVTEVRVDIERGNGLPVEATPTYVINGVVIKGSLAPQYFDAAILYELEQVEVDTVN
ncbi:MAG: vitamin K epoxide reductase family protein [Acidobacteriota bacterium]|nr:vitamin K epoxide reductase family protein [Acidobacteriota bacterium]